ncbi:MAG TPA: alpha/beta fold hydrolase, partial [Isosphaeraceae bacterium]|nr:alpha/beta fold hydrolase [Isosphaeraceae bacterium]
VEFLEQRRPGKPVIAYGMSLGGAAAIFASGTLGHRVHAYVLESPYRDLKTAVRNRVRTYLPPLLEWVAYEGLLNVSPLVLPELEKISPLAAIEGIPRDVPVLLLAGGKDRVARPEETRMLYDRVSAHGKLVVFEGSDHHNLLATASDRYRRCVLEFLAGVRSAR